MSAGTVGHTVQRARGAGLDWAAVAQLTDEQLEQRLYGSPVTPGADRAEPDCSWIHHERHRPGVTLELLHLEYLEQYPEGLRYTAFCERYRSWLGRHRLSMRQTHVAGEKAFVDYAGKKPHLVDALTGEVQSVELFVAVLGASNYTYAEATLTQSVPDWVGSHVRAFEAWGGVPQGLVCDCLKSGVIRVCRYEPTIQRTYEEMATHYGTAILPARPIHPRDKAKVEVGVQVAERWILARLRNDVFHNLAELNARIRGLLEELNERRMRLYRKSRRQLFEELDRPALLPLPAAPFEYAEWRRARVNIDYHVALEGHFYSVPYQLVHEEVEMRATATAVEVLHRGRRVAGHARSRARGQHTTVDEHMPSVHRAHAEWTPSRLLHWAASIGPETQGLVEDILRERRHPEQGFRSCLGILRLSKRYGPGRLEAACARARAVRARSFRHVASILEHGLDRVAVVVTDDAPATAVHENVRGRTYYH
jgi:transposase